MKYSVVNSVSPRQDLNTYLVLTSWPRCDIFLYFISRHETPDCLRQLAVCHTGVLLIGFSKANNRKERWNGKGHLKWTSTLQQILSVWSTDTLHHCKDTALFSGCQGIEYRSKYISRYLLPVYNDHNCLVRDNNCTEIKRLAVSQLH
jgi:hypothetical protein